MISKILLALDDSPRAAHVVTVAAELAERLGATLIPFRAMPFPQEFPAAGGGGTYEDYPAVLLEQARRSLEALVVPLVGVDVAPSVVGVGDPATEILVASERLEVDLIAIGSHGFRGWDRLLGTTVSSVANRSKRHVFVIHDASGPKATKKT